MRSRVGERIFRVVYVHIGPLSTQLTLIALAFLAADRSESDCQPSSLAPENTSHSGFYAHSCWIAVDATRCKVGSENESGCCMLSSDAAIRLPGLRSHPDSNWGTWKLTFSNACSKTVARGSRSHWASDRYVLFACSPQRKHEHGELARHGDDRLAFRNGASARNDSPKANAFPPPSQLERFGASRETRKTIRELSLSRLLPFEPPCLDLRRNTKRIDRLGRCQSFR